ncbi:MAG: glycosyltransferase like 2 family protein [Massilia sp.]|jgi:GT2 family glycosyltransferase|nr:glycosyltransferase like 2 family protein [Massilia sp.]MDB5950867.1 glycosyltransferase like 2 family protein [Massilia sp.]
MSAPLTIVVLTCNRAAELRRTLRHTMALTTPPPVVVVDNGAGSDGTRAMLAAQFPSVRLIAMPSNIGAAGRNAGALAADTPYVAFCDDDTWWAEGSLEAAVAMLDFHPALAVVCARVVVGEHGAEDPTCALMAASPLPREDLPGPALLGFLAGAAVVRRSAFLAAGGYEPRFLIGGEESLLSLDLLARGWRISYAPQLTVHHHPSPQRDSAGRRRLIRRNALWLAWLRLPAGMMLADTLRAGAAALRNREAALALLDALRGLPWALARRRVIPAQLAHWARQLRG